MEPIATPHRNQREKKCTHGSSNTNNMKILNTARGGGRGGNIKYRNNEITKWRVRGGMMRPWTACLKYRSGSPVVSYLKKCNRALSRRLQHRQQCAVCITSWAKNKSTASYHDFFERKNLPSTYVLCERRRTLRYYDTIDIILPPLLFY